MIQISEKLDLLIRRLGDAFAWINVILILAILVQVILRYVFGCGQVYLEEIQWHLFGLLIMFGFGYCVTVDAHIRLDVFHRRFSPKTKEIVDLLGSLFLLFPLVFVLFVHGIDFVESSFRVGESSDSPLGLPYRWLIKAVIPVSMIVVAIAILSKCVRAAAVLFAGKGGNRSGS